MALNAAAIVAVMKALVSAGQKLGEIDRVYIHEPKSAPGEGVSLALPLEGLDSFGAGSGLASVSCRIVFFARFYRSYTDKEEDRIDPDLLAAVSVYLSNLSAAFTLLGNVRNVDIFGEAGPGLSVKFGYVDFDSKAYRVADLTLPVIINDAWTEAP